MSIPRSEYLSSVWKDGIFGMFLSGPRHYPRRTCGRSVTDKHSAFVANRVLFITGGAGSIGSAQTRALVHLGADACIIGRNVAKTEAAAKQIALVRPGAKVLGIGGVDVRNVSAPPTQPV
jgi:2,4-dienoyl-CoA reductase [(3E)-enoyl-CoA-producing], peroxisomal